MSKSRKRSISSAQLKMRALHVIVDGTGSPVTAAGFDRFGVKDNAGTIEEVQDNGVGDYTIHFVNPFERSCQCSGLAIVTADCIGIVTAVAFDRITIKLFDATDGVTAKDGIFHLSVIGSEARYDV